MTRLLLKQSIRLKIPQCTVWVCLGGEPSHRVHASRGSCAHCELWAQLCPGHAVPQQ